MTRSELITNIRHAEEILESDYEALLDLPQTGRIVRVSTRLLVAIESLRAAARETNLGTQDLGS